MGSAKMKTGMCKGCWALCEKEQVQIWDASGRFKLATPIRVVKPFCSHHGLHLDYMDRVVEGDKKCLNYYNNRMD
jgi:hypothetical protein